MMHVGVFQHASMTLLDASTPRQRCQENKSSGISGHGSGLTNEDGYEAAILLRSRRVSMRENSPRGQYIRNTLVPRNQGLGVEAARCRQRRSDLLSA